MSFNRIWYYLKQLSWFIPHLLKTCKLVHENHYFIDYNVWDYILCLSSHLCISVRSYTIIILIYFISVSCFIRLYHGRFFLRASPNLWEPYNRKWLTLVWAPCLHIKLTSTVEWAKNSIDSLIKLSNRLAYCHHVLPPAICQIMHWLRILWCYINTTNFGKKQHYFLRWKTIFIHKQIMLVFNIFC